MSIKITKKYKALSGKAPFVYTWSTDNDCVSLNKTNGSFSSEFDTEFTFDSKSCLDSASIQLNIIDSIGCSYSQAVTFNNPCDEFVVEDISKTSSTTYSIYANQASTYDWGYDSELYSANINGSVIVLIPKFATAPKQASYLTCIVTSNFGCVSVKYYNLSYIDTEVFDYNIASETDCQTSTSSVYVELSGTKNIDWSTLEYTLPANVQVTNSYSNKLWLSASNYPNNGEEIQFVEIPFKAKTFDGVYSNQGYIRWAISECSIDDPVFVYSPNVNITEVAIGKTIEIPIIKSPNVYVKTFDPTPNQVKVDDNNMTTPVANVVLNDKYISYEITSLPTTESEVIQYMAVDANGNETKVVQVMVSFDTITAPDFTGLEFTLCHECGNQTPYINMAKYIEEVINPRTITIVEEPSNGTVVKSPIGNLSYYGDNVDDTGNYFTFSVENKNGVNSIGTVKINLENRCGGVNESIVSNITCLSKVFNLEDLFTGYLPSTRLWTDYDGVYTAEGGTITDNTGVGTVNFTGMPSGTYKFKQTSTYTSGSNEINCNSSYSSIIELFLGDQPDAGQLNIQLSTGTVYRIYFDVTGVSDPNNITVTVNGSPATFIQIPTITSGVAEFYVQLQTGTNNISVSILNDCGGTIVRTTTIEATSNS